MAKTVDIARIYDQLNEAIQFTRAGQQLGKVPGDDLVLGLLQECVAEIKTPTWDVPDG